VRLWSANQPDSAPVSYRLGSEARQQSWIDYPQGITQVLAEAGAELSGFDARVESTIPLGSGLSSSAALLVAFVRAIRDAFGFTISDTAVARFAHRAETTLVGAPVGIMDQMVCSLGRPGAALLIDTRSLDVEHVTLPSSLDLIVIDSGVHHAHAGGEYRTRRAECEEAAKQLGVASLRDVPPTAESLARIDALPQPLSRRARHVVTENVRVKAFVAALTAGNLERLGALLQAGHASLRDDFAVSTPEVDALVEITESESGVLGARMTGGGFGGSIVALAEAGQGRAAAQRAAERYAAQTSRGASILLPL
jgi:galactokinase